MNLGTRLLGLPLYLPIHDFYIFFDIVQTVTRSCCILVTAVNSNTIVVDADAKHICLVRDMKLYPGSIRMFYNIIDEFFDAKVDAPPILTGHWYFILWYVFI